MASPTPTNSECGTANEIADPASNTESRALRFLINEHLLNCGYKMSAVQFAEECEVDDQQDLDDWDDVRHYSCMMITKFCYKFTCHEFPFDKME